MFVSNLHLRSVVAASAARNRARKYAQRGGRVLYGDLVETES